jgi:hypothetical protein
LSTYYLQALLLTPGLSTPPALNALLDFVFSEEDLNNWVKMEWCKVYDMRFLEEEIIGKMQRIKPMLQSVIDQIKVQALGAEAAGAAGEQGKEQSQGGSTKGAKQQAGGGGQAAQQQTNLTIRDAQEFRLSKVNKDNITKVQPFNLTKPKPRLVPEPQCISRVVEAKPVPKTVRIIYLLSYRQVPRVEEKAH